jgi:phenylacetate-CoA ligase
MSYLAPEGLVAGTEEEDPALDALKWTLSAAEGSPLYRRKFTGAIAGMTSLEDLKELPFTTKEDLRRSYPYGAVAVSGDDLRFFVNSSGTSGRPIGVYLSSGDLERTKELAARCFSAAGIGRGDRVLLIIPPISAHGYEGGFHRIGAMTVNSGPGNTEGQMALIRDLEISTVLGVPSYLLHLGVKMEEAGLPREPVRRILTQGEALTESVRRRIEGVWEAEVYDCYGSIEMVAGFLECSQHHGHHVPDGAFIMETVDPETGEQTDGRGELVFTTLIREAMPLIRYRTGDLVEIDRDRCPCGRSWPRVHIKGRLGGMVKVKGSSIYPGDFRGVMARFPEVLNFRVIVERECELDVLRIKLETDSRGPELARRVSSAVKGLTNVTPEIEFVAAGSLLGRRKSRQFIDKRGC